MASPAATVIPYITGDGIGQDISSVTRKVVDAAVRKAYGTAHHIRWEKVLAGEEAVKAGLDPLPEATLRILALHKVALKGPLGTPTGKGHRSLNVRLRQHFDLYACVRPVQYFAGVQSPLKKPENVHLTIFRENCEDIYAGIEFDAYSENAEAFMRILDEQFGVTQVRFPASSSFGIKPISEEGSKRIARAAFAHAVATQQPQVTIVHKGNIQKFTEGNFAKWAYELAAEEFADALATEELLINDVIADNFFQQLLLAPEQFSTVVMTNLNGDYASDAAAATVGGLGIAPGANINYATGQAIFEATHGTAPAIAGQNKANPCSLLLSSAMLLDFLQWDEAAKLVRDAVASVLRRRIMTGDLASQVEESTAVGTREFAKAVLEAMEDLPECKNV